LKGLQATYGWEVVTFTADLGQGEELGPARQKALLLGIKPENIYIEDLREEFVRDYVFPRSHADLLSVRGPYKKAPREQEAKPVVPNPGDFEENVAEQSA